MTLIKEIDYGTPASQSEKTVTLTIDGTDGDGARGHVDHARGDGDGHQIPKLCATDSSRLRLLPPVPGRDRGPQRHAGLVHDAGRDGHGRARRRPSG